MKAKGCVSCPWFRACELSEHRYPLKVCEFRRIFEVLRDEIRGKDKITKTLIEIVRYKD